MLSSGGQDHSWENVLFFSSETGIKTKVYATLTLLCYSVKELVILIKAYYYKINVVGYRPITSYLLKNK